MKSIIKILTFSLLLGIITFFPIDKKVSASENYSNVNEFELYNRPPSIEVSVIKSVPVKQGAYLPQRIWYTKGDYRGYLPLVSYEKNRDNTFKGLYKGKLYLYVAPLKETGILFFNFNKLNWHIFV